MARSTTPVRPKLDIGRIGEELGKGDEGLGLGPVQIIRCIYETSEEVEDPDRVEPIKEVLHCEVQVLIMKRNLSFFKNERVSIINFYLRTSIT